jgi:hypothetical protein
MKRPGIRLMAFFLVLLVAAPPGVGAQAPPPAPPPPAQGQAAAQLNPEQLDQLVSPVALYPDPLLAQILMASTYPLDVVQAARWAKANPNVTGAQLEAAMQQQQWDPSVKSLTATPQVLTMMNERLDWTQRLGDAFLAQQKDVMDAIQRLRGKAYAAGNLKTTPEQKVVVEPAPAPQTTVVQQAPPQIIQIEPANPQVVYVPSYNPAAVYGAWPYPAYPPPPPYYYPGYAVGAGLLSFGAGMAVGAALWGNCNWGGGNVNINANQYNNFNKTNIQNTNWQHNAANRKGVAYRDQATAQRFGQGTRPGADSREAFRGRAEAGRQQLGQGGFDRGPGGGMGDRGGLGDRGGGLGDRGGPGGRGGLGDRGGPGGGQPGGGLGDRGGGFGDRGPGGGPRAGQQPSFGGGQGAGGGRGGGAFQGMDSGRAAQFQSQRGHQSMGGQRGGGGQVSRPSPSGGARGGGAPRGGGGRGR